MLLLLLLFWRTPRALEGGPSGRQHVLGVGREDYGWGRRTTVGDLPEDVEIRASLQTVFHHLQIVPVYLDLIGLNQKGNAIAWPTL